MAGQPTSIRPRPDNILPFSGYVGDLDCRPVRVVPKSCSVADASRYFAASDIEYLVIHENRIPLGVVHKFELVRQNMARAIPPESPVADLMTTQVITVQHDQPVLESLMFMIRHDVELLLIMHDKQVVGAVSQQDWVALQTQHPTQLVDEISRAETFADLAALRPKANETFRRSFHTKGDAVSLTRLVTVVNDAITRRAIWLCIEEMAAEGRGEPPAPFAWIGMGSEGRAAQTVATDQDNGLLYEDVSKEADDEVRAWFSALADKVVSNLEKCGFALCNGNVMATNPELCGSLTDWCRLFERIITTSDDKDLFEASIYFDFRCLFGKASLVDELKQFLFATISTQRAFMRNLVETAVQGTRPPIHTFRWRLYTATGIAPPSIDIKKNGLLPLDAAVRVLALLDGIEDTPTIERLELCLEKGRISKRLVDDVLKAFDFLLRLRFKIELSSSGPKDEHSLLVDIRTLPPAQARYLGDALEAVSRLQEFTYEQVTGRSIPWSVR